MYLDEEETDTHSDEGSDTVKFGSQAFPLFNFTYMDQKLKDIDGFDGFAPRYTLVTKLTKDDKKTHLKTSAVLFIIDSKREIDIGLGRYFSQKVIESGGCMVSNNALKYLGVEEGGTIKIGLPPQMIEAFLK